MATTLCDVTVGVSTAVSVMPVLQSERQFSPAVDIGDALLTRAREQPFLAYKVLMHM